MPSFYGAVGTIVLLYACRAGYRLIRTVVAARKVGLPMLFSPADSSNFLWAMASVVWREELQELLPAFLWKRVALTIPGWESHVKAKPFDQAAPKSASFSLVGPSEFVVWTVDPQAVHEIAARHDDFETIPGLKLILGKYGPNVMTVNGERWTTHRKLVATVLTDRISRTVFEESCKQAADILAAFVPSSVGEATTTKLLLVFEKLTSLTLGVLVSSCLGDKFPWSLENDDEPEPGHSMKYTESLHLQLNNLFGVGALPMSVLTRWPSWLPGYENASATAQAIIEFGRRNKTLVDQERARLVRGEVSTSMKADLLTLLVHASEEGDASEVVLAEGEIISNMFIFMAGGFKTIAAALHNAMVLLAAFPQWQEWLLEEVDSITQTADDHTSWEYSTVYPKAVRAYAFLMELMRLHGTTTRLTRVTTSPQVLHTATATVRLPAEVRILTDLNMLHRLPCWRGINHQSDPLLYRADLSVRDEDAFRPSRWINPPGSTHTHFHPPKGTFLPWGGGPRVCPGQKMAQVEIIAVLLWILDKYRIAASPGPGETQVQAEKAFEASLDDVTWGGISQLTPNENLNLKFIKRR
ncbi:unnamed protein product [Discula destructiva]